MSPEFETCQNCGKPVGLVWAAPDDLWAKVSGFPDEGGILCILCFDEFADRKGIFLTWRPSIYESYEERMEKVRKNESQ